MSHFNAALYRTIKSCGTDIEACAHDQQQYSFFTFVIIPASYLTSYYFCTDSLPESKPELTTVTILGFV